MRFLRQARPTLLLLHRWISVVLAPILLLVLLSAAVLATRPIVGQLGGAPRPVDAPALVRLLDRVDPDGKVQSASISLDGTRVTLQPAPDGGAALTLDLATGETRPTPFDLYGFAKRMHEGLFIGAGALVGIGALGMCLVIALGLLLGWRRLEATLLGWHAGIGWLLLPLLVIPPFTGVLVWQHIGGPRAPEVTPTDPPMTIARAIERAVEDGADLTELANARKFRAGSVRLNSRIDADAPDYWIVSAGEGAQQFPGGYGLVRKLHEGTWGGALSGTLSLVGVLGLLGLLGTGVWSWGRRAFAGLRHVETEGADVLVAFASQTGNAARLAEATAAALQAGGTRAVAVSFAALDADRIRRAGRLLAIVSTTGTGEVPEPGRPFLRRLEMSGSSALDGVSFALLALGDRRYGDANFCGGGETMRAALLAAGATEAMETMRADGPPAETWRRWLDEVSRRTGLAARSPAQAPVGDRPVELTLVSRVQLNRPEVPDTNEVWALTFESEVDLDFRPGDLVLVAPPSGGPERPYSVGSSSRVDPRRILLTVGLVTQRAADGSVRLGETSGYLCRQLREGDRIRAALRAHPEFRPPEDPRQPILLVSAGCGIAPFPGFVAERELARKRGEEVGPVWFVFGNNRRAGDFLHGEQLERWHREGLIERLDTAFFLDEGDGRFAQHRLAEAGDRLVEWMERRNARLYVCGRASTLGVGVDKTLREILVAQGLARDEEEAAAKIASWEERGAIRRDLFG